MSALLRAVDPGAPPHVACSLWTLEWDLWRAVPGEPVEEDSPGSRLGRLDFNPNRGDRRTAQLRDPPAQLCLATDAAQRIVGA